MPHNSSVRHVEIVLGFIVDWKYPGMISVTFPGKMMLGWVLPHCSHPVDAPSCLIASKSVRRPSASPHPHLHSPRPTLSVGFSVRDFAVVSPRLVAWTVPALKTSQASQSGLVNFRKRIHSQHLFFFFHDCWFLPEYSKVSFLESQNCEFKMRKNIWKSLSEFNALFYRWGTWDCSGHMLCPKKHSRCGVYIHLSSLLFPELMFFLHILHNTRQSTYQTHRKSNYSFLTSNN